jgi:DNA polymerase I-like protein with 3'-5' exonuclease and polymerase domains
VPRFYFDYEADGLFADTIRPNTKTKRVISRVHCLVLQDIDTGAVLTCHDSPIMAASMPLRAGVELLLSAETRAGHNIGDGTYGYDERVTREFFPDLWAARRQDALVLDTLVGAEVVWPFEFIKGLDATRAKRRLTEMPKDLIGKHSLEAWGWRLGNRKSGYEGDFQTFDADMLRYCIQDVSAGRTLFLKLEDRIKANRFSLRAWLLEQKYKGEIELQQKHGVAFDMPAAEALTAKLQARRAELRDELVKVFPPFEDVSYTDERVVANAEKRVALWAGRGNAKKVEEAKAALVLKRAPKVRSVPFNPSSRHHIARALQAQGWKVPKRGGYTASGQVKIDESVLEGLREYDGVPTLIEHFVVDKRLSQLAESKKKDGTPWMKTVREDGRIHGKVRHNAAITNRCTHSSPNMTAVPKPSSPYGPECRALFIAPPGRVLVGGDLKGIQLRGLAHFLVPYDGGAFIDEVLNGDPHEKNRALMQLPTGKKGRDDAKTTIYAVFFGAQGGKVASILGCDYRRGVRVLELLLAGRPALARFKSKVGRLHLTRGSLRGPDGRYAFTRSAHSAIATALQLFEAVVMKQTVVLMHARFRAEGLDAKQVLSVHDEVVLECPVVEADRVATIFRESVREAGRVLESKCPLEGDVKVGKDWFTIH